MSARALLALAGALFVAGCATQSAGGPPDGLPVEPGPAGAEPAPAAEPGTPSPTPAGTPTRPAKPSPAPRPAPGAPASLVTPAMVPARFADLPGWDDDDPREAWPALQRTCGALRGRAEWATACAGAARIDASDKTAVRRYFSEHFTPWRIRNADAGTTGLATGYYEPMLTASRTRSARFGVPLYAPPDDLIGIDLGDSQPDLKDTLKGLRLRGRLSTLADGRKLLIPYWTRAELMTGAGAGALVGKAIVWVEDPIEAFFLQVQGSGRIRLTDGRAMRLGYADTNGHPYRSIGRWLVDHGQMKLEEASMQGIQAWARANPSKVDELLAQNPSYIFFRELPDDGDERIGPVGALAVPLTAERSIAVDPRSIPLGVPVWLSTTQPNSPVPLRRLVLAQDTGSAIKGGVRADVYFGSGAAAGELAGRMKQKAEMWALLPNEAARR
ncbi:murein transglycosylase A [Derxia gummosa]|uniref:peptidoglycan lytic exotransglycosylase n=1 Tax=Derxia gummosa DSM 723 TaxID=1121388 RepID=A0A9U5FZK0_9BURK|nr:MltA domain-containing protein [Derxia gummosa]